MQNLDNENIVFKLPVSVHLILIEGNNILLLKRKNTGYADGLYCLPCGRKEKSESASNALIREAKEEVGITILKSDVDFVSVIHKASDEELNSWESVCFFSTVRKYTGEISNMEPDKCSEVKFFPINKLPENLLPIARAGIRSYFSGDSYIELDWK